MNVLEQLKEWLNELLYRDGKIEEYFQFYKQDIEDKCVVYFYTRDNRYCLVAKPSSRQDGTTYFGCQVSSRKPRAGEDWTRGNDLADGKFNQRTWNRIKNDIISYELVKIAKKERSSEAFDVVN